MPPAYQASLERLKTSGDRYEIAEAMLELADRAERSPLLQEILRKIKLRPPFENLEYIKCYNRKGYWRRAPLNPDHPTVAQAEFQLKASQTHTSLFGIKGVVERLDGTRIPLEVHLASEMMRGMKFTSDEEKEERKRKKAIERIVRTRCLSRTTQ